MATEPTGPRLANVGRQDQIAEELLKLVDVDESADVVRGTFTKNLLIDPDPIGPNAEVVGERWLAPSDMEQQLTRPLGPGI